MRHFAAAVVSCLVIVPLVAPAQERAKSEENTVSVWVSEVILGGGKTEELGEFPTWEEAAKCSTKWSKAHPDDLHLTHEREVKVRKTTPAPGAKTEEPQLPRSASKPGDGGGKDK